MTKIYIKWRNGNHEVREYADQQLAYSVYLALPKGVRAAFRASGDKHEVFSWDYVDC